MVKTTQDDDSRKLNGLDTLAALIRGCTEKNLSGWEIMEVFAGGVKESDAVFHVCDFRVSLL